MAKIINTRSPFFIKVSDSTLDTAKLELYIYEGVYDTSPDAADLKYTIEKSELEGNNIIVFEISELVRDYIETKYDGEYDSYTVWVNPVITATNETGGTITSPTITPSVSGQFIATEGYGYFEEGANPDFDEGLMMSEGTIYRVNDRSVNIPVSTETTNSVSFLLNGETVYSKLIDYADPANPTTSETIQYIASDSNSEADSYKERVLEAGGTFEYNSLLEAFEESFDIGAVDEVYVNYTAGSEVNEDGDTVYNYETKVLKVKTFDCSKYEPIRVTFVNKYGALQDLYFTRRSNESINITSQDFKASVFDFTSFSYDQTAHQQRTLNLVGKESVTLNTDYIDESCNEHIKQLMLSEQIWMTRLTDEEKIVPLKLKSNSLQLKTRVNDRLVQYTMQFDVAADKINTIR
jgi:hypothetical protein